MAARTQRTTKVEQTAPGYPRPQLQRPDWTCLDGVWDFALDESGDETNPADINWKSKITVPFAPETPASGVENAGFIQACWYRRQIETPALDEGQRLILHFGAVDYVARVFVNGSLAAEHEGGYTPFSADITDLLKKNGPQTVVVHAMDDPLDMCKPRGKQDWLIEPHSIWYFRTTGIWQTVWMEVVPETRIAALRWTASVTRWEIALEAKIAGTIKPDTKLRVRLTARDITLSDDVFSISGGFLQRTISLPDPGIGDGREFLYWSPHRPTLIVAELQLLDADGESIDAVASYTAMREVSIHEKQFILNGSTYKLQLVLNQGYWPQSGLTAPNDAAYQRDVELIKEMGFNGVRMHQKIESPRFLHWADKLGLLVWGEMPSAYAFSPATVSRLTAEWQAAIERDVSHPCIVAWVPFNESWGVPDLTTVAAQRHLVRAIYHLTKSLDSTRPVIGNDGWEMLDTDILAIHDYDRHPAQIAARYQADEDRVEQLLSHEQPGGRALLLEDVGRDNRPIMLTEFGGVAYSKDVAHTWGYSRAGSSEQFARLYFEMLSVVRTLPLFSGFCYTQFTDTYQEANGLLYMDRSPKFPINQIAVATRGAHNADDEKIEAAWRKKK